MVELNQRPVCNIRHHPDASNDPFALGMCCTEADAPSTMATRDCPVAAAAAAAAATVVDDEGGDYTSVDIVARLLRILVVAVEIAMKVLDLQKQTRLDVNFIFIFQTVLQKVI